MREEADRLSKKAEEGRKLRHDIDSARTRCIATGKSLLDSGTISGSSWATKLVTEAVQAAELYRSRKFTSSRAPKGQADRIKSEEKKKSASGQELRVVPKQETTSPVEKPAKRKADQADEGGRSHLPYINLSNKRRASNDEKTPTAEEDSNGRLETGREIGPSTIATALAERLVSIYD